MKFRSCLVALICGIFASSAEAQIFGRRARVESHPVPIYPQFYTQPYSVPTPAPAVSGTTVVVTPASNCPCLPAPTGHCSDNCVAPFQLTPSNCPVVRNECDIPFTVTPIQQPVCQTHAFYGPSQKFQDVVNVPVLVETCTEVIKFETVAINLQCCTVSVCVPCKKITEKTQACTSLPKKIDLESFRRKDGMIDVYALNVPGMPTKYVQRQKMSEDEYKVVFRGAPVPMYP